MSAATMDAPPEAPLDRVGFLRVVRGRPAPEDLAVLLAVLAVVRGGGTAASATTGQAGPLHWAAAEQPSWLPRL